MAFTSYAQSRQFETIDVQSNANIQAFLQSRKFGADQLQQNQRVVESFANTFYQSKLESDRITAQSIRDIQKFQDDYQAYLFKAEKQKYDVELANLKRSQPKSRAAMADKAQKELGGLGGILEMAPKFAQMITGVIEEKNAADYKHGIQLIDSVRATTGQIADLRNVEGDLKDQHGNYVKAAQALIDQGATEEQVLQIRSASGWTHYGIIKSGLRNSIPLFSQEILNRADEEFDLGDQTLTLNEAKASGNIAAVNAILSQIRGQFAASTFDELGIGMPNHALATEFFKDLDKVQDAYFNDAWRTAQDQAGEINKQHESIEVENAMSSYADLGYSNPLAAFDGEVASMYSDPNNKNWRGAAWQKNWEHIKAYFKHEDTPIDLIEDSLNYTFTNEHGKKIPLGMNRQNELRSIIEQRRESETRKIRALDTARDQAREQAWNQYEQLIGSQGLNNQAKIELWESEDDPWLKQKILATITDPVPDAISKINSLPLQNALMNNTLTTEMVNNANISEAQKQYFLNQKGIDDPHPNEQAELSTYVSTTLKQRIGIESAEQLVNSEDSLRTATAHITEQAMAKFSARYHEVGAAQALKEAKLWAKEQMAELDIAPAKYDETSKQWVGGTISQYTLDGKYTAQQDSRALMREAFDRDKEFYKHTPLDTVTDFEELRTTLAAGRPYMDLINSKFPWVRYLSDGLYNGQVKVEEILEAQAKLAGVDLKFPEYALPSESNLTPDLQRQVQSIQRQYDDNLQQVQARRLEVALDPTNNATEPWRQTFTGANYTRSTADTANLRSTLESGQPNFISIRQRAQILLDVGFPQEVIPIMIAISAGESGGDAGAHNPNASTGDNSYGLWQINMLDSLGPSRRAAYGLVSNRQLFDPYTNAKAALALYHSENSLYHWTVYDNGSYKQYLPEIMQALQGGQ